ncbi:unnamed protein product, partial [Amoebophrya sp. A25]
EDEARPSSQGKTFLVGSAPSEAPTVATTSPGEQVLNMEPSCEGDFLAKVGDTVESQWRQFADMSGFPALSSPANALANELYANHATEVPARTTEPSKTETPQQTTIDEDHKTPILHPSLVAIPEVLPAFLEATVEELEHR